MKSKRADRKDWWRVPRKRFAMRRMETQEFTGYVSLISIDEVREPLLGMSNGRPVCLVDVGYTWLQHFPQGAHYAVTAIFDAQGDLVSWYIDICKRHYLDDGVLWYDDLYLDLDVSPDYEITLLDVDELDTALLEGEVTPLDYELAWREANSLMTAIEADMLPLLWLAETHREQMLKLI